TAARSAMPGAGSSSSARSRSVMPLPADSDPDVPVSSDLDRLFQHRRGFGGAIELLPNVTRTTIRHAPITSKAVVPGLKRIAVVGDPLEEQIYRRHYKKEHTNQGRPRVSGAGADEQCPSATMG